MNQIHKKLFKATAENDRAKVRCRFANNFWDFDSTTLHLPLKILLPLFLVHCNYLTVDFSKKINFKKL
jgi:hypothetical protein